MGIFVAKKLLKIDQNLSPLIEQAFDMSKITLPVIVYLPFLNKTAVETNK